MTTPKMKEPQLSDTDELSLQDETDSRHVLARIPTRKSHGTKQGNPLRYEYVKVSKGGPDPTREGWQKPRRKVRTSGGKAEKSSSGAGRDENFFGGLASDEDNSDSEPARSESSVAEQDAGEKLDNDGGLQAIQNLDDSKPSQAQSPVAQEDDWPELENDGWVEGAQGPSDGTQSTWDKDIWNQLDWNQVEMEKEVWGGTVQEETKYRQIFPEGLHTRTTKPQLDASEENSDDDGEGDEWADAVTTKHQLDASELDIDNDGGGDEWADVMATKAQLDASEQDSDDDGGEDEWADAVSFQDVHPQDPSEAAMFEVADSEPKLPESDAGGMQTAREVNKKKKKHRKPKKKMEFDDKIPNEDISLVEESSPVRDTLPVKDKFTHKYIAELTSRHRFVDPGGLSLAPETTLYHLDTKSEGPILRSQIVALTLNECCVTAGRGEVLWVPPSMAKARGHTDLIYTEKTWSNKEQQVFWNKSPLARMLMTKRSYLAPDPPTNAISITLASEDKEILRWPEDSTAIMLLWYGLVETQEIVFLWAIQQLRQLAEIEAGEYAVHWSDLPEDVRRDWVLCSHDSTSDRLRHMMVARGNVNRRLASEAITKKQNKLTQWKWIARPGSSTKREKPRSLVRAADEQTEVVATKKMERVEASASTDPSAETQKSGVATPSVPMVDYFRPKLDVGFAVSSRMKDKAFRNDNLPFEDTEILTGPIGQSSRSRIIRPAVSRASRPKARTEVCKDVDQPLWSTSFIQAGTQSNPSSDPAATPLTIVISTKGGLPTPSICSRERLPIS